MDGGPLFSLTGRTVMITGASSGLGSRLAEVAAANGAKVVLVARRQERLEALCERLGDRAIAAAADVTDQAAMARAFDSAEAAFGPVTVFVANAAISKPETSLEVTPESWRRMFATDLDAVFFGAQEAARRMIAAKVGGSIITVSSIAGMLPGNGVAAYSIAKRAVIQATEILARDLGPHGIRANVIAPGWILTEMSERTLTGPEGARIAATTPLRRYGEPSDFDGAFLLLASDAGRFITGATLVVDGGRLLSP